MVEALRAGRYPARSATAPSRTTIPTNVSGSVEAVRNKREAIRRATASEAMTPTAMPISASRSVFQITSTETRVQLEVIWKTLRLALIGIAVGVIASLAVARLIASLLFRTASTDPLTFVGMVVLLGAVALLAGYLPARRASTIDPMVALRTN